MAMMRDNVNNPLIYKNVHIKTENRQVTLSGKVKDEKQRSKLISMVSSVVSATNIHDDLQIK